MEYSDLYGEIAPIAGNVPRPTVIRNVRNAVITFCKESRAYTQTLLDQVATDYEFTPAPPSGTRVWGANWISLVEANRFKKAEVLFRFDETEQMFSLENNIRTTDLFNIEMVLVPTRLSTACSDGIMEPFFEVITAGAIAGVLMMSKEEWYDPNLGMQYSAAFAQGIDAAIYRKRNDDNPGPRPGSYGGI